MSGTEKPLDLKIEDVLEKLARNEISVADARKELGLLSVDKILCGTIDIHRKYRTGVPEVVFGEGKEVKDIVEIVRVLVARNNYALVTRINDNDYERLKGELEALNFDLDYNAKARTLVIKNKGYKFSKSGKIGILAAGTLDIPVAEEARVAAEVMGCEVLKAYDVGVAGLHRVAEPLKSMLEQEVSAIVVVAGMEGVLPSLVAGLVDVPVIGVPTSVGYGMGGKGVGALTTMLQSCSPGLAVVNIDNGFGGGVFAGLIARVRMREGEREDEQEE